MGKRFRGLVAACAVALAGCAASDATRPAPADAASASTAAAPRPAALALLAGRWPLGPATYRTTDPAIHRGNLEARIAALENALARPDATAVTRGALAGALLQRWRLLGRIADGERALALANEAADTVPGDATIAFTQAALAMAFHAFAPARAALSRVDPHGREAATHARLTRELALAEGRYDRLADDLAAAGRFDGDFFTLAARADLRMLQGDLEGASALLRAAQDQYRDVDPMPLAWLHTQQGIALLRFGRIAEANRFFAAAHARLPDYYLATEHLAETEALLGRIDAARALYRDVIAQTGNPEFLAALAEVEAEAGDAAAAARLHAEATAAYEALLERHPAAYAQHAAEYFLARGDTARARALAETNLGFRRDLGSLILGALVAEADGDRARACALRAEALALGFAAPERAELDALAGRCDGS